MNAEGDFEFGREWRYEQRWKQRQSVAESVH